MADINDDDDFQDGWDDDADLDLDLDDDDDEEESESANAMDVTEALPVKSEGAEVDYAKTNDDDDDDDSDDPFGDDDDAILAQLNTEIMDTTVEGWDEDEEEIVFEEIESSSPVAKEAFTASEHIVSVAPPPHKPKPPVSTSTNMHTASTVTRSAAAPAPRPAVAVAVEKELTEMANEGWGDDDDDLFSEESESSAAAHENNITTQAPDPAPTAPPLQQPKVVSSYSITEELLKASSSFGSSEASGADEKFEESEGWDDDEDLMFDTVEEEEPEPRHDVPPIGTATRPSESTVAANENNMTHTQAPAPTAQSPRQAGKVVSTYSTTAELLAASSSFGSSESSNDADKQVEESSGWDDDADLMFDTVDEQESEPRNNVPSIGTATRPPPPPPPKPPSPLYTALEDYLLQLPRLQSSINAVLEYECNTDEKANELVQYYSERPGLTEYTVKKELPRMEYALVQGPNKVVTDKKEIAQRLHQDASSLISRCANQSLLADLLQVFTGSDLLVRPQYMAAALAVSCRFRLDLSQSLVQVQAQLDLCLPTENGRWKVAELLVRIDFCSQPDRPFVKYQLEAIRPAVQPNDPAWPLQLHGVVEMLGHLDLGDDDNDDAMHPAPAAMDNNFRDVFLQQSQSMFQNSAVGIRSAWQEIDTVAGFSNKLGRLPRFDDVMQHAEIAAEAEAHSASSVQERPTSILGGFFGKLAKSVALPDEDPSMYQDWQAPVSNAPPAQPVLYSRSPAPSAPRFYNKETPSPPQRPQLYNKLTPPPPDRPAVQVPKLYNETPGRPPRGPPPTPLAPPPPPQPPSASTGTSALSHSKPPPARAPVEPEVEDELEPNVEDGWDDDLNLDDDEDESVSAPVPSPPKPRAIEQQQQPVPVKLVPPPSDKDDSGDWVYNLADDIIPTRKRWVNPRPGSRQLRSFATQ
jgi:hypothetical protein